MNYIEAYKNIGKGKTCAILGGGTSLPYDIYALPEVDTLFGVNQHSAILQPEYTVFLDTALWPLLRDYETKFICREPSIQSNTNLEDREVILYRQSLKHRYSGSLAMHAASYMGYDKIYVCGIDQYKGFGEEDARYWWWQAAQTPAKRKDRKTSESPDELLSFVKSLTNSQNIYFMSGRMKELHQ
jgi:hypothetical protein